MQSTIELLKSNNELTIIDDELDIELEIPHIAYIEVKKEDSKALLFTNPVSKANGKKYDIPVLMNVFGSFKRLNLLVGNGDEIAGEISTFLKLSSPKSIFDILYKIKYLFKLKNLFPKKVKHTPHTISIGKNVNLFDLPILKTWELDGGAFITMGQIYTQSLNGEIKNLGMYRLQVYDKNHLGMHWQIHKDSTHFFNEYKNVGQKMPVSIAIGGDPLYTWCGQAPLPYGMYELMLYGFIKNKRIKVRKSITNDLYVPLDCDIVIEGFVDTQVLQNEGPFGDHTGFYTPVEPYPVLEVSAITMNKNPIYLATVVGKPPLEDKYMGYMTERVFLPLLQMTNPALIDYCMPENGVFHNLILVKMKPQYPAHAEQLMHSLWSVGQMSFVKHAIFLPHDAPQLRDYEAVTKYILNHFSTKNILISHGVCDALDHSSPNYAMGGKLGVNCTNTQNNSTESLEILSDEVLLENLRSKYSDIITLRQYFINTNNPITLLALQKREKVLPKIDIFNPKHSRIIIALDFMDNDLDNLYMCLWRIANNIDAMRDIAINGDVCLIDATSKGQLEGHSREWPLDVECSNIVLERLLKYGIIARDEKLWKKYHIDKIYTTQTKEKK